MGARPPYSGAWGGTPQIHVHSDDVAAITALCVDKRTEKLCCDFIGGACAAGSNCPHVHLRDETLVGSLRRREIVRRDLGGVRVANPP